MGYKKIATCPEGLEKLILLFNHLPRRTDQIERLRNELETLSAWLNKLVGETYQTYCAKVGKFKQTEFNNELARIQKLVDCSLSKIVAPDLLNSFYFESPDYPYFDKARQVHLLVQQKLALMRILFNFNIYQSELSAYERLGRKPIHPYPEPTTYYQFNDDTTISLVEFEIFEILERSHVPIFRIRICPICQAIYWARKMEAPTCRLKKCSNAFHSRKHRRALLESELSETKRKLEAARKHFGKYTKSPLVVDRQARVK